MVGDRKLAEMKMLSVGNDIIGMEPNKVSYRILVEGVDPETKDPFIFHYSPETNEVPTNDERYIGVKGYYYTPHEILFNYKVEKCFVDFAEDYDYSDKSGYTFYEFFWYKDRGVNGYSVDKEIEGVSDYYQVVIFYTRKSDYQNILKDVMATCKFVDSEVYENQVTSNFTYSFYTIAVTKNNDPNCGNECGGWVTIKMRKGSVASKIQNLKDY